MRSKNYTPKNTKMTLQRHMSIISGGLEADSDIMCLNSYLQEL